MGLNLSRPQYAYHDEYYPRVHPADYFRRCDPNDCFCGQPHARQRHVAVQQTPGGQVAYRDPMQMMDRMLMGNGMYGGAYGGGGYNMPGITPYSTYNPGATANIMTTPSGNRLSNSIPGWPAEWKDPREWTTADYNRLGEVMDEYTSRMRGRNQSEPLGMPMFDPRMHPLLGSNPMMNTMRGRPTTMDDGWADSNMLDKRQSRGSPSFTDFEMLREQMMRFAQDARDHIKATNDFLYGSEKEIREERYKDRQRRMIEEILKTINTSSTASQPTMSSFPPTYNPVPAPQGFPGSGALPGMNPFGMMPGSFPGMSAPGMGGMGLGGMGMAGPEAMNYGDMRGGYSQRPQRPRRPPRGLSFGVDMDDDNDGFGRRGGRRGRGGFGDDADDLFNLNGDGRRGPKDPNTPGPRPNNGGGGNDSGGFGAFFDDIPTAPQAFDSRPATESWRPPFRTATPPPIPPRPRREQEPPADRAPDYRFSGTPPPYEGQTQVRERWDNVRPRVSFEPGAGGEGPATTQSQYRVVND